jgi:hypothetical protein
VQEIINFWKKKLSLKLQLNHKKLFWIEKFLRLPGHTWAKGTGITLMHVMNACLAPKAPAEI